MYYAGEQVSLFGADMQDGKTSRDRSAATKGATFKPSSRSSSASRVRTLPPFLCLTKANGENGGGYMGYGPHGRWSVAYRTHDAQFWGVPQRRRRISVLADYGGWTAHRILFDPQYRREAEDFDFEQIVADFGNRPRPEIQAFLESMSRYSQSGGAARQGASAAAESGAGSASGDGLVTRSSFCLQGNGIDRADTAGCNGKGWTEDVSYTLNTIDRPAVYPVTETYDVRISSEGTLNQRAHCYRTDISRCLDTGGEDPDSNHGGVAIVTAPHRRESSAEIRGTASRSACFTVTDRGTV